MSKKHFSWLLVVTVVVAIVVLLLPGTTGKENLFQSRTLLPDLAGQVNDIKGVEIVSQGPTTVAKLLRSGDEWVVAEAASYPANWESLRSLLKDLAQAEIIENKTSKAEFYSRLGVEDLAEADATGVMVVLSGTDEVAAVIIGKSAQGRQGQYVRLRGVEQSALIGTQLRVASDIQSWLQRSIVDISASEVVEFKIAHADGETVNATKVSADDADFQLQGIPDGREIQSAWSVNQVGGALSALQLEGVKKADDADWSDSLRFSLLSADGLLIEAELVEDADDHWIRLVASAPSGDDSAEEPTSDRVNSINARVSGWAYRIASYKYDSMAKRMEDMLKELDES